MDPYDPYYADDTDGVHFLVCVDGQFVQCFVARDVLTRVCRASAPGRDCVEAYLRCRHAIDEAVVCRVRKRGPETVLVQADEIGDTDATRGGR